MKQSILRMLLLSVLFCFSSFLFSQKYEAESASLSGDAAKATSSSASGGSYVEMKGGNLSFNVTVSTAGLYTMTVVFSQTYDNSKTQNLSVNSQNVGSLAFPKTGSSLTFTSIQTAIRLSAGGNTVGILNSWGWVDIDYIEITSYQKTIFDLNASPVTPHPTKGASVLYSFLKENFQKKTISGVMTLDVLNGNAPLALANQTEVKFIKTSSGKTPALVGFDFMHATGKESGGDWFKSYTGATISMATELWEKGGIPAFCWHWRDPLQNTNEFYTQNSDHSDGTNFDLKTAFTDASYTQWNTNSNAYKAIIRDIDIISGLLKQLQDKGVAVLWRPLHEASGGWFWWGAKGAAPYVSLYRLMFDRMVNTNGVNNLIWVWTSEGGADADWYPGDKYVDIIARDYYYYPRVVNHNSLIGEFEKLKDVFGTKKIITLGENGSVPYPENMQADNADWSYFMPWYGDYTTSDNTASDWNKIMNNDYVITLEDMPGWKSELVGTEKNTAEIQTTVFPARIKDVVYVVCSEPDCRILVTDVAGRLITSCSGGNKSVTSISCGDWNNGLFLISVFNNSMSKTFKVIK